MYHVTLMLAFVFAKKKRSLVPFSDNSCYHLPNKLTIYDKTISTLVLSDLWLSEERETLYTVKLYFSLERLRECLRFLLGID